MNVLLVIHSLSIGGAEMIVTNYAVGLKRSGINVSILEFFHTDSYLCENIREAGIPIYTAMNRSFLSRCLNRISYRYLCCKVDKLIKRIAPNVIHYHTNFRGMELINFPPQKCVLTIHSKLGRYLSAAGYLRPMFQKLSNLNFSFIAITKEIKRDVQDVFNTTNVTYIPNGHNFQDITEGYFSKKDLCKMLSIPDDSFILGQVGRFNPVKNHTFTINLFADMIKTNNNSYLVFVGTGSDIEINNLRNIIKEKKLEEKVIFMGVRNDATRIMKGFDSLILPSVSEASPLVVIEAQINGVRCVVSETVPKDMVCNKNCVQLNLSDSMSLWIQAINGELTNRYEKSLDEYELNNVLDMHIKLYNQISNL